MPTYANGPVPALPIAGGGVSIVNALPGEFVLRQQVAPTAYTTTATITAAELATRMLTVTNAGAITITLPTATLLDTAMPNAQQNDSVDFSLINLGAGTWTLAGGTGVTTVGTMTTATATATMFRLRKTNAPGATSAWVVYRVG
jgi:hypothetical protein